MSVFSAAAFSFVYEATSKLSHYLGHHPLCLRICYLSTYASICM
jgi:hypothetical protein